MKRPVAVLLLCLIGMQFVEPASARVRVFRRGPKKTTVVVHRGWPIHRAPRAVVVRPPRVTVHVTPARYWAPVVFTGVVVVAATRPAPDVIVWEDGETLSKSDDWTEFTLSADSRGKKLWLEVASGKVQFDWVEVVFENEEAAVVDFQEKTHGVGFYELLDFKDGRKVDHVRIVARARTGEARVVLRMQKE